MEWLAETLPIIIYCLLIILIIVLVVLGIKSIITVSKVDKIIDGVKHKVESLTNVFKVVDGLTDKISSVGDLLINLISNAILRFFKKDKKEETDTEEVEKEKKNE